MTDYFEPFLIQKNCRTENPQQKQLYLKKKYNHKNSWTLQEHQGYLRFFAQNMDFTESSLLRKTEKIFVKMTHYVKTRTPVQIKSHHQKLLAKYGSIQNILWNLEEQIRELKATLKGHLKEIEPGCGQILGQLVLSQAGVSMQQNITLEHQEDKDGLRYATTLSEIYLFDILDWPEVSSSDLALL